jgi:PHD/YefM family antitoxin component YafN of YafNO toxin-antitoxin module
MPTGVRICLRQTNVFLLKVDSLLSKDELMAAREQYVVDPGGNRTAVLIDVKYYQKLLDALEELESIRAYDEAKASDDEAIPFVEAVEEIERERR